LRRAEKRAAAKQAAVDARAAAKAYAPLTKAEIRAMTKKQNAEGHEACSADAHRVIRKMIGCGMDVSGVSVQWMCQNLNPSNIALLAETQECQELRALLNI
jgi:hypothetical protein